VLEIQVNGAPRSIERGATVMDLVTVLALDPRHVAVERNTEIVPRALWQSTTLQQGDRLEVVTFVGGG
jgi:thiamine biosynthesis protein ThiS